jgi:hypothetical protein
MKNSILALALCLGIFPALAQRIVEKHIAYSPGKLISMNFQISDSIRIITWNKNEVYLKSSINVNDNKNNDDYKMNFGETEDNIDISGKLEMEKGKNTNRNNGDCNCCCGYQTTIYHDVYIPENADISVETINGNIVLTGNIAGIRAHTISGFIDLAVAPERKADLMLGTISGTLYTNFTFPEEAGKMRHVGGNSLTTRLNGGGGKPIELKTISGNIFLRKAA